MPNPHENLARLRKAVAIAEALRRAYDATPAADIPLAELVDGMTLEQREDVARAAGQRSPSTETWALVVQLVGPRAEAVTA